MKLHVNNCIKVWKYNYVIDEKYHGMEWSTMEVNDEESHFARWVLLNENCKSLINKIATRTSNEAEFEEVIQESYIAYYEMLALTTIEEVGKEKFKSTYLGKIHTRVSKYNMFGANISSKKLSEKKHEELGAYIYDQIAKSDEKMNVGMPFEITKEEIIKKVLTEEEYEELLLHYNDGRSTSIAVSGKNTASYYQFNKRRLTKYKRRLNEYLQQRN